MTAIRRPVVNEAALRCALITYTRWTRHHTAQIARINQAMKDAHAALAPLAAALRKERVLGTDPD